MKNFQISDKFLQGFNEGNWDVVRECLADEVHYDEKATGMKATTPEAWIESTKGWKNAFSNATGTILNRIELGDTLVEEIMWSGLHDGDMHTPDGQTIPATHKEMNNPAVMISKFKDGKIVETKHYFDMMTMLNQLGLMNN